MKLHLNIFFILLLLSSSIIAQDWTLKLSSNVELRTWKLTSKADKEEKSLGGANIKLYKGNSIISELNSDANGDFTVLVPPNGDFILEVSFSGCNTKKFSVSTNGVPENIAKDNFKPTFSIGGFVMAKPFPGIDYSGLQQALVKVEYKPKGRNFDHDDAVTDNGLNIVSKIASAENILVEKFCSTNRAGDAALAKPDCPLAKSLYEKAISIIPGEQYPVEQLAKVGLCLKDKEEAVKKEEEKKLADLAAKEKAAAEKLEADKLAKEKAAANKTESDKAAKEKAANDKALKDKAIADKASADKTAREKLIANRIEKEKAAEGKVILPKEGKGIDPAEKEAAAKKAEKQNAAKDKAAKQKEGLEKSRAEDIAAEKSDYEKREASRKAKEKAEMDKANSESKAKKLAYETKHSDGSGEMDKGNSDHKIPQVLGANKYKEVIITADDYFKTKRYKEAKTKYEEALKIKTADVYSTNKLAEIEKILNQK